MPKKESKKSACVQTSIFNYFKLPSDSSSSNDPSISPKLLIPSPPVVTKAKKKRKRKESFDETDTDTPAENSKIKTKRKKTKKGSNDSFTTLPTSCVNAKSQSKNNKEKIFIKSTSSSKESETLEVVDIESSDVEVLQNINSCKKSNKSVNSEQKVEISDEELQTSKDSSKKSENLEVNNVESSDSEIVLANNSSSKSPENFADLEPNVESSDEIVEVNNSSSKSSENIDNLKLKVESTDDSEALQTNKSSIEKSLKKIKKHKKSTKPKKNIKNDKIKKSPKNSADNDSKSLKKIKPVSDSDSTKLSKEKDTESKKSDIRDEKIDKTKADETEVIEEIPVRRRSSRLQKLEETHKAKEEAKILSPKYYDSESDEFIVSSEASEEDEAEDSPRKKRNSSAKSPKVSKKLAPIFLSKKEKEKELKEQKEAEARMKVISEATREFLYSGVPDIILRAQKANDKKLEHLELLETYHIFPVHTHVNFIPNEETTVNFNPLFIPKPSPEPDLCLPSLSKFNFKQCFTDEKLPFSFCCSQIQGVPSKKLLKALKESEKGKEEENVSWIEKYAPKRKGSLVVDAEGLEKFESWLKQWQRDILDDGGSGRKIERKKPKKVVDDFIDDDTDDLGENGKKSVVLYGPSGSGKTAMVYVLAKKYKFKVVEVNFSTRRSGHEVIRSVEEATLSRSLSKEADIDEEHCLVLFKDLNLYHGEEDEGFYGAVAQLISASLRPIVMTLTTQENTTLFLRENQGLSSFYTPLINDNLSVIDAKIEKRDPLWIHMGVQPPSTIASKILLPIVESETEYSSYNAEKDSYLESVLESIARHSKSDIRKSINQLQLSWSTHTIECQELHKHLHVASELQIFTQQDKLSTEQCEKYVLNDKERNRRELRRIAKILEDLTDADRSSNYSLMEEAFENIGNLQKSKKLNKEPSVLDPLFFRSLMLSSDETEKKAREASSVYEEICLNYVDAWRRDFEEVSYVRSIAKGVLNSSYANEKRNGRINYYFQGMNKELVDRVSKNFDFGIKSLNA